MRRVPRSSRLLSHARFRAGRDPGPLIPVGVGLLLAASLLAGFPRPASAQEDGAPGQPEDTGPEAARVEERVAAHAGDGAAHELNENVRLLVEDDREAGLMSVRLGPLELPARTGHHGVAQAPDKILEVPFDGWIVAYSPRLVDEAGEALPGRLLHHVGFWHTDRSDFLCPNKEEHVFGAGGELNEWVPLPGFGYPVRRGERIRVNTMFHNPTAEDHPETWLEVTVRYRTGSARPAAVEPSEVGSSAALTGAYPAWFDVQECGRSAYDLPAGESVTEGRFTIPVAGRLLGVGGHLHDYGRELVLYDETRDREIARLPARLDERGHIVSMPVAPFLAQGGYRLEEGDVLRVEARYVNPADRPLVDGAMGIVVGYFVPEEDARMEAFRR